MRNSEASIITMPPKIFHILNPQNFSKPVNKGNSGMSNSGPLYFLNTENASEFICMDASENLPPSFSQDTEAASHVVIIPFLFPNFVQWIEQAQQYPSHLSKQRIEFFPLTLSYSSCWNITGYIPENSIPLPQERFSCSVDYHIVLWTHILLAW